MNISFKTIEISNFLSLGKDITVSLSERGFTLVSGQNLETSIPQSNGSGKSSIFDAIFWTITGETLRGATDVVNEKSTGGCRCTLTLDVDGTIYKIMRSKGDSEYGNACYFYENDELLSDQTRKSQDMISNTIPTTSSDILGSIVLLGQGLPYKFSSLSPSKRKDLLEVMSGSTSQIDKVKLQLDVEEENYNSQIRTLSNTCISCKAEIDGLTRSKETLESQLRASSNPETINAEIASKMQEIEEYTRTIEELKSQCPALNEQYERFNAALTSLQNYISGLRHEISMIDKQMSQIKSGTCPTCGRPYDGQDEAQRLISENNARKNTINDQLVQLDAKYKGLSSQVSSIKSQLDSISSQMSQLGYSISSNETRIKDLNNLLKSSSELQSKIDGIEKDIRDRRITINESQKSIDNLQQYVDAVGYLKRQMSRDFKGYMLEEVIKYLSTRSEFYSSYLFTNGKTIEVSLSGNKILITVGGRLYENLSGGERQRVDLAVQFALRDMLVVTAGFSCNLIVLDEAFDNLDAQGSEALIRLVTSELSDIDSVFVVTHHSTIAIPYDNSLLVTKGSDGISTVKEDV